MSNHRFSFLAALLLAGWLVLFKTGGSDTGAALATMR
jgi:hypothetical protein